MISDDSGFKTLCSRIRAVAQSPVPGLQTLTEPDTTRNNNASIGVSKPCAQTVALAVPERKWGLKAVLSSYAVVNLLCGQHYQTKPNQSNHDFDGSRHRGRTDTFHFDVADVGVPNKVRIGHDNKGNNPRWNLERLTISNKTSGGPPVVFPCGETIFK